MNGYPEDLRQRIVSAAKGGMSKAQAARTFSVGLASVKRYANKAGRGESLVSKKSPGFAPKLDEKANKPLKANLQERPYVTLQDSCDYIETVTGAGRLDRSRLDNFRVRNKVSAKAAMIREKSEAKK
jgi:transposase